MAYLHQKWKILKYISNQEHCLVSVAIAGYWNYPRGRDVMCLV